MIEVTENYRIGTYNMGYTVEKRYDKIDKKTKQPTGEIGWRVMLYPDTIVGALNIIRDEIIRQAVQDIDFDIKSVTEQIKATGESIAQALKERNE